MSHLCQPNKGTLEPVILRLPNGKLIETWRTKANLSDEEFQDQQRFELWCKRNQHKSRKVSEYEAIHLFKKELYGICMDNIVARNDTPKWKRLLNEMKKQNNLIFQDKIKQAKNVPIESVVSRFGYEIRMNKINCPFHEDPGASCHIYVNTNTFYCFGCNKNGDTIDFVQSKMGSTFKEAINYLV